MAFREVPVFEVREVLRLWLDGRGLRPIAAVTAPDRKTIRRMVEVAVTLGLDRDGDVGQLDDAFVSLVMAELAIAHPDRHGESWAVIVAEHERIAEWHKAKVPVVKMHELLARRSVVVPERTLHRYVAEQFGPSPTDSSTVPLADCEPGTEVQVDWAKLGFIVDRDTGRRRTVWALLFTSVFSRHCFVWLSYTQALEAVIAGFDAAWVSFGGVFKVVIPDNMKTIVTAADATDPQLCEAFVEYAQWAGFFVDPARVRAPQDKARVERNVRFLKDSFWAGETFADLAEAQAAVEHWCRVRAGMRTHGTTGRQPLEVFTDHEQPALLPVPAGRYDLPIYRDAKVARDHHIQIAKGLYSVPGGASARPWPPARTRSWSRSTPGACSSRPTRGWRPGAGRPTPRTCRRTRRSTRCVTSTGSSPTPRPTAPRSARSPGRCSITRCPGPGCGRSTSSKACAAATARTASTRPVARPSMSSVTT